MTTTTQLHGYGHYTMTASVRDSVLDFVGEFADDFDIDGLSAAFRAAVNEQLDGTGITLIGDDFHSRVPVAEDAAELIKHAIADVDLGGLAQDFDRAGSPAE